MTTAGRELNRRIAAYVKEYFDDPEDWSDVTIEEGRSKNFIKLRKKIWALSATVDKHEGTVGAIQLRCDTGVFTNDEIEKAKARENAAKVGMAEAGDEVQWEDIMNPLLKTVLSVDKQGPQAEWHDICTLRMRDTVQDGITELALAEALEREAQLYE